MSFRAISVAVLLSVLPIAGCGTIVNAVRTRPGDGGEAGFGGVKRDLSCIDKAKSGELDLATDEPKKSRVAHNPQVGLVVLCAMDLPLSFVGDVLMYPFGVVYKLINEPVPVPPPTFTSPPPVLATGIPPASLSTPAPAPPGASPAPIPPGMLPTPTPAPPATLPMTIQPPG